MARSVAVIVLFSVLFLPIVASAQEVPFIFNATPFNLQGMQCSVSAKAGFQHMAVNFNLPVPTSNFIGAELYTASNLDFKLEDGGVWIGGVGADLRRGPISAFVELEANAGKNARVVTSSEPFWAGEQSVVWKGSRLQWWAIDGGAGLDTRAVTIVGGLRVEQLTLKFTGPVDSARNGRGIDLFEATFGDRYRGDFSNTLWLPYVGIRTRARCWSSTLRMSPVAWTDLKIPARYFYSPFLGYQGFLYFEQARYTFKRGGLWLDGSLDYDLHATRNFHCSLWLRANWLGIRGNGTEGYQLDVNFAGVPPTLYTESRSASGIYTSYTFGGGLRAEFLF